MAKQVQTSRVTLIGMMHDLFDSATAPITSKHLPVIAEQTGFHLPTLRIQFYKWSSKRTQGRKVQG